MEPKRVIPLPLPPHIAALDIEPVPPLPPMVGGRRATVEEDETERAERLSLAKRHRRARYFRRLPKRYTDASYDDLTPEQDVEGRVSGWLAREHQTLLLASMQPGNGKTHSAYAVCRDAVENDLWVEAWVVMDLLAELRPGGASADEPDAIHDAMTCDLLLLDDLGRERVTDWTTEQVHRVLNHRLAQGLRTIVTTNLTYSEMGQRYTDPLVDRIMDDCVIVKVTGESRRKEAPW